MFASSIQDRDLLARLNRYIDDLDARVREGCGWFIFTAGPERANRVQSLLLNRLVSLQPLISYYFLPWRDFSLNAYMLKYELKPSGSTRVEVGPGSVVEREYQLASRVSLDMYYQMRYRELLIVAPVRPAQDHEVEHLESLVEERYQRGQATILITPMRIDELARTISGLSGGSASWDHIYSRMYESSLIAL